MEAGSIVNLTLIDPSEHYWGRLIALTPAGIVLRGIDVRQIERFKYQFKTADKRVFPQTVFFPMRRVQQVNLDEPIDALPSIIQAIVAYSGQPAEDII